MFVPVTPIDTRGHLPAGLLAGLREAQPQQAPVSPPHPAPAHLSIVIPSREVPDWVRWVWRGGMALFIALGPVLIAAAESNDPWFRNGDFVLQRAFGVGVIVLGVFCFLQSFRRRITSWWSYLIKPLILYACLQSILVSAFILGMDRVSGDEQLAGIFFIIFPAIMFLTLLFVKAKAPRPAVAHSYLRAGAPPPLPTVADGVPSVAFEPPLPPAPRPAPTSIRHHQPQARREPQKLRILANLIGWAFHTLTFFIAIAVVLDLPGFINAGLMDQRLADDMRRDLGANWARLAHMQGYILVYIGAFVATMFLMLGRRSQGILHMLRPIFAAACFLLAMAMLDHSLSRTWMSITTPAAKLSEAPAANSVPPQASDAIVQYLDAAQAKLSILSLFLALAGLALLLWPAPQPRLDSNFDRQEGVA